MSKDYEYEYNRKQKVWDPNERHTREDTLTEGVVGLVGIVGVTAIVTGLASKKVRSNIAKIFGRPPAAPKPGPRAPRPLLRTLNPLCTSPYDKKSSTASGNEPIQPLKLTASTFDRQAPAAEAEEQLTEEEAEAEAEATKAANSLLNRYLNASVGQYPKHPIDWSEGCAKAKLTTALRLGSIEAEQAPLPVPESSIPLPTTQVVNLFKNSNLVAAEISRLETSKNLEQFAETQRPTVTPETLELTVPGTVEVTEIETANTAVTTGNADIAATCVKADITDPTVNEDITASAVKTGITVPTANAAITASAVKADITTAAVKADIATPAAKADLTAPAVKADITATGGNAKITATSEEADITNTAEKANKTAIAGKEDITESSKLSERVQ
ncbi:GL14874 [Drosophila persimilis]|uniref:GL14874 n=1 Tax=Drosophila persimilis TaxID=7234 RepID=B4H0E4_DROPE|nr:GL14874 [Drosophila persimilis]